MRRGWKWCIISAVKDSKCSKIVTTLREEILSGKYSRQFPSERALMARFRVSRPTARQAVSSLCEQGLVVKRQGSGTFITKVGSSRKIGLIVPDVAQSEFFSRLVREVSALAQKEGYTLLFGEIAAASAERRAAQAERLARDFIVGGVSGVIFQPIQFTSDSELANARILSWFDAAAVPVVLCDYDFVAWPNRSRYDVVGSNNIDAGAMVVKYLVKLGAKRIHFLLSPYAAQSQCNRLRGVMLAAAEAKVAAVSLVASPDDAVAIRRDFRRGRPDAFVCSNDNAAAVLKKTLERLGVSVPEDVMLVGFDDVMISTLTTPQLTTVRQECGLIAKAAFYRLLERISNPNAERVELLFPTTLVERASTIAKHKTNLKKKGKHHA